jgi:hypothetical protein
MVALFAVAIIKAEVKPTVCLSGRLDGISYVSGDNAYPTQRAYSIVFASPVNVHLVKYSLTGSYVTAIRVEFNVQGGQGSTTYSLKIPYTTFNTYTPPPAIRPATWAS